MVLMPDDEDGVRACVAHDPTMQWKLIHVSLVTVRRNVTWSCSGQNRLFWLLLLVLVLVVVLTLDVAVASYLSSSDCHHDDGLEAERSRTGATFFGPVVAMRQDVHVHDNRVDEEDRYLYCRQQCHGRVFVPPPSSVGRLEPMERLVHRILFLDTSLWKRLCIPRRYSKKIPLCVRLYTLCRVPIKTDSAKKMCHITSYPSS